MLVALAWVSDNNRAAIRRSLMKSPRSGDSPIFSTYGPSEICELGLQLVLPRAPYRGSKPLNSLSNSGSDMQSRTWISLLNRIPQELQDFLVLVTSIGTEISIQSILRIEEEYIVLRGRLAGTTDTG